VNMTQTQLEDPLKNKLIEFFSPNPKPLSSSLFSYSKYF